MDNQEELVSLLKEITATLKLLQNEHNAISAAVTSIISAHPNPNGIRSFFVAQMDAYYDSFLQSLTQEEKEEKLKIWHTLLFLLDDAIQKNENLD